MIKIKGIETTDSYVRSQVDKWIENSSFLYKHIIEEDSLIEMVHKCIRHSKRVSRVLRKCKK